MMMIDFAVIHTFFLLAPAPFVSFIDALHSAYGQDNGNNEKENATNNSGCDGFIFDLALNDVRHFLTGSLTGQCVRVDPELVRLAR